MSNKRESEITNMLSNVCFQRTDIKSVELLSNVSSSLGKNSHSMLLKHRSISICTKPPSYRGGREFNFPNNTEKWLEANYKSDQEKLQTANNSQFYFDIKIIVWVLFLECKFISITVTMRAVFHTLSTFNKGKIPACLQSSCRHNLHRSHLEIIMDFPEVSKWGL